MSNTLSFMKGDYLMPNAYYRKVKIRIVYRDDNLKLRWRFEYAYHVGNLYGDSVRLCVYKDERSVKPHWYCVDPETGLSLGEGKTRIEAADMARSRVTHISKERYEKTVSDIKQKFVEQGLMSFDYREGYRWLPPKI